MAEALAREISYDGALIRLCAALDVRATPAWFDLPERERSRLEGELERRGIRLPGSAAPRAIGGRSTTQSRPRPRGPVPRAPL